MLETFSAMTTHIVKISSTMLYTANTYPMLQRSHNISTLQPSGQLIPPESYSRLKRSNLGYLCFRQDHPLDKQSHHFSPDPTFSLVFSHHHALCIQHYTNSLHFCSIQFIKFPGREQGGILHNPPSCMIYY